MIRLLFILMLPVHFLNAQQKLHVKRTDNRFLFYQLAKQNDTIIAKQNDLFLIKLPDSLQAHLSLQIENGLFKVINNDSLIYQLQYVNGMKYSHQKTDTLFSTLLEGNCKASKKITVSIYNNLKQKEVFRNLFWVR